MPISEKKSTICRAPLQLCKVRVWPWDFSLMEIKIAVKWYHTADWQHCPWKLLTMTENNRIVRELCLSICLCVCVLSQKRINVPLHKRKGISWKLGRYLQTRARRNSQNCYMTSVFVMQCQSNTNLCEEINNTILAKMNTVHNLSLTPLTL